VDFKNDQVKTGRVVFQQVPGIGGKMMFQMFDESRRPETGNDLLASQANPQQTIEPDEMIHMGMGYKKMGYPQDFSGLKVGYFSQIEKDRPPVKTDIDKQSRVSPGIIHQMGMKKRIHG
jgi:hypothetical protein